MPDSFRFTKRVIHRHAHFRYQSSNAVYRFLAISTWDRQMRWRDEVDDWPLDGEFGVGIKCSFGDVDALFLGIGDSEKVGNYASRAIDKFSILTYKLTHTYLRYKSLPAYSPVT